MRSEKVRVYSAVDDRVLTHISEREARLMCGEDSFGNSLEGVEPTARRMSKKKEPLLAIRLMHIVREEKNSPCTLTMTDMALNAAGSANPELRREARGNHTGNSIHRAMSKVEAWPDIFDQRNVIVSAGKIHGATFIPSEALASR